MTEREWAADTSAHVAVNREFLLEALAAGGPIRPLAVRVPGDDSRYSILMPVRH